MQIKNLQALLFDLDGTLIDTAPTFVKVLNQLLQRYGKEKLNAEIIRTQVSHGARALITLAFGITEGDAHFETLRNELLDLYELQIVEGTKLFPSMEKVLIKLKENAIPWGIVTNKPSRFTFPLIEKLGLNESCAVIICPDDVENTKPDPEPLNLACFRLNVKPENCIYIGDHERDIQAGNAAGMFTVSALFGYIAEDDKPSTWNAKLEINSANDILKLLNLS
jgi:phosphoglycolate phosphatase